MDKSSSANIMLPGGVWVLSRRPPEGSPRIEAFYGLL